MKQNDYRNQDNLNAIDFPCSYAWRSYYQETFYGEYLPSIEPPEDKPEAVPEIHYIPVEPNLTNANTARQMRQLRGELAFMRNKLNELSQRKQRPPITSKQTKPYKGIEIEA